MNDEPLLEGRTEGARLKLAGTGDWIAKNARLLEACIEAETRRRGIKDVAIDMAAVEHLDTFGAWLLEKLMRAFAERGAATRVTGLKEDYRRLVDEVHGVELEKAATSVPTSSPMH